MVARLRQRAYVRVPLPARRGLAAVMRDMSPKACMGRNGPDHRVSSSQGRLLPQSCAAAATAVLCCVTACQRRRCLVCAVHRCWKFRLGRLHNQCQEMEIASAETNVELPSKKGSNPLNVVRRSHDERLHICVRSSTPNTKTV